MRSADSTKFKVAAEPKRKRGPRPRGATVARYVARIAEALPIRIYGFESQLTWLLSESSLDFNTAMFADCLRNLCRVRFTVDEHAQFLVEAVEISVRHSDQLAALMPVHEALTAYASSTARKPSIVMRACRVFLSLNSSDPISFPAPFEEVVTRSRVHPRLKHDVSNVVAHAVRRIVAQALSASLAPSRLAAWSADDREAALAGLWLAYSHTHSGTTNSSLSKSALSKDFHSCGKPLWARLVGSTTDSRELESLKDRWSSLQMDRMTISLTDPDPDAWDWDSEDDNAETQAHAPPARHRLVVCPSGIVPGTDRSDRDEVDRHRVLETPLPVAVPPTPEVLKFFWEVLHKEFPWATRVLDVVFTDLIGQANLCAPYLKMPATLLVGTAGSGKSRLVRRLAEVLALPRLDIGLGGMTDTKVLAGTSRGWASGRPSGMATLLARQKTASAIVMLDELDKASGQQSAGDAGLSGYLLGLLEPETARRHYDVFLKTECDFSGISWLCTANSLEPLSGPMRSRLRVLHLRQPAPEHFEVIAESVLREMASRYTVPREVLPPLKSLQLDLSRLGSARQVRTAVEASVGRWSSEIVRH